MMSETRQVGIDFGSIHTLFLGCGGTGKTTSLTSRILFHLHEERSRLFDRCIILEEIRRRGVFDIVLKVEPLDIGKVGNEIIEKIKSERFLRRFTSNEARMEKTVSSYRPANVHISVSSDKPEFFSKDNCAHEDNQSLRENAVAKHSIDIRKLPRLIAVHLWRDKRHRRKRRCDFGVLLEN